MSYTPDNQKLEGPVADLKQAIDKMQDVFRARINASRDTSYRDWSDEHLDECREWIKTLTDWEMQLNKRFPSY